MLKPNTNWHCASNLHRNRDKSRGSKPKSLNTHGSSDVVAWVLVFINRVVRQSEAKEPSPSENEASTPEAACDASVIHGGVMLLVHDDPLCGRALSMVDSKENFFDIRAPAQ